MIQPKIHLICNAHLDPVWQWRWEEGCAETLATFRTAVQLLHEYPDFIFNHNEALLYQWVLKYDAELFAEIQKLVNAGRWFISGGWYLQPDVNLPGTESIIRHIAEGRRFFKQHFGVQPQVAYNFDSFGHSGGLPQILKQAGYKMYLHLRPQSSELELPSDLYRWQGVDGSEIIGYRIAVGLYHTEYDNIEQRLTEGVDLALKLKRDVPVFWGIGNHGGGATRADLGKIRQFQQRENRVEFTHSTPDQFYESVKDSAKNAPIVQGDLQRIFTGCYTSLSRIKRGAVKSLHRLVQAETLRTATWWLFGQNYPEAELVDAWQDHLFNDFHDILPGSCTEPAERDALDLYGKVAESIRRLNLGAAVAFNKRPEKDYSIPITILNTLPDCNYATFETQPTSPGSQNQNLKSKIVNRKLPVEVECMISHRPKWSGVWHLKLFKTDGTEIPCQEEQPEALLPFNGWRRKVSFMAELPGIGVAHYYLQLVEGEKKVIGAEPALKFQFDEPSGLIQKLDSSNGQNCLAGRLIQPIVVADEGDSWGTNYWSYREVIGNFQLAKNSFQIIETGPIRTVYQS
ncbi:alpha-mannosidase, partial [candidate division KSB1 bacterium]